MSSNEDKELVYEFMTAKVYKVTPIGLGEDQYPYVITSTSEDVSVPLVIPARTLKEAIAMAHKIEEGKITFQETVFEIED